MTEKKFLDKQGLKLVIYGLKEYSAKRVRLVTDSDKVDNIKHNEWVVLNNERFNYTANGTWNLNINTDYVSNNLAKSFEALVMTGSKPAKIKANPANAAFISSPTLQQNSVYLIRMYFHGQMMVGGLPRFEQVYIITEKLK